MMDTMAALWLALDSLTDLQWTVEAYGSPQYRLESLNMSYVHDP